MRPLELRLRNFRSYTGDEVTFDLRDRSLIGIVGAIGSGKSSILDAIAFGLYGKTPSAGAATKSLIHQRSDQAAVALRFAVEGDVYEVVRSLRRKGASQHALYRYESDDADADPVETITQEADVNRAVIELLGLEFDVFTRSVLLAQGRFAEFLSARPSERDKVLKGVFGHDRIDRMREIARRRSGELSIELAGLEAKVEQLDALESRLQAQREQLELSRRRVEALLKAEPGVVDLERRIDAASKAKEAAGRRLDTLREHEDNIPGETTSTRLLEDMARTKQRRLAAADALEAAANLVLEADAEIKTAETAGLNDKIETAASVLAELGPLREALATAEARASRFGERVAQDSAALESARERLDTAATAAADSQAEAEVTTKALTEGEAELHRARHHDMATTLRAELHEGESCPVCRQVVVATPSESIPSDLSAAEEAVESARLLRDRAEQASARALAEHTSAAEVLDACRMALESAIEERDVASREVEGGTGLIVQRATDLTALLGDGNPEQLLADLRDNVAQRRESLAAARKAQDRARSDHDEAIRAEQDAERRLAELRVDVVEVAGKVGVEVDPTDEVESMRDALAALREGWRRLRTDLEETVADAAADRELAESELKTILESLEVDGPLASEIASAGARVDVLESEEKSATAAVAERPETTALRNQTAVAAERYARIGSDLTNSRFVRFLLDDERERLAELGSIHFERLSSGRYRFTEDGAFNIVDLTAADAIRKADSLSGGETFLASLALALALAEMVTRTGGRLDAFFLDEGFGSLDPEHLDLAMEGVEALAAGAGDRLVVVVSHVPELRHRLEDLIELDRDPTTGNTKVVSA